MTAEELAASLTGIEYPADEIEGFQQIAKDNNLVVVFGMSDDLMEFRGAIHDEVGVWEGGTVHVNPSGLRKSIIDLMDNRDVDGLRDYFKNEGIGKDIEAVWCEEGSYSWTFRTDISHVTFEIIEDGEPYCRGIVFALADCA